MAPWADTLFCDAIYMSYVLSLSHLYLALSSVDDRIQRDCTLLIPSRSNIPAQVHSAGTLRINNRLVWQFLAEDASVSLITVPVTGTDSLSLSLMRISFGITLFQLTFSTLPIELITFTVNVFDEGTKDKSELIVQCFAYAGTPPSTPDGSAPPSMRNLVFVPLDNPVRLIDLVFPYVVPLLSIKDNLLVRIHIAFKAIHVCVNIAM